MEIYQTAHRIKVNFLQIWDEMDIFHYNPNPVGLSWDQLFLFIYVFKTETNKLYLTPGQKKVLYLYNVKTYIYIIGLFNEEQKGNSYNVSNKNFKSNSFRYISSFQIFQLIAGRKISSSSPTGFSGCVLYELYSSAPCHSIFLNYDELSHCLGNSDG